MLVLYFVGTLLQLLVWIVQIAFVCLLVSTIRVPWGDLIRLADNLVGIRLNEIAEALLELSQSVRPHATIDSMWKLSAVLLLLVAPVWVFIRSALWGIIIYVLMGMQGHSQNEEQATLRSLFCMSLKIHQLVFVGIVPLIGSVVSSAIILTTFVIGLRSLYRVSLSSAVFTAAAPFFVFLVGFIFLLFPSTVATIHFVHLFW